ncbi:hypothetical protein T484DRAFT_1815535 [Baffinella frigidus]|nr:hypothetical protein T484DRAFT_1815535 [Cryptophyta sp. CCMP2293]
MGFRRIVVPLCLAASLLDGTAAFRAPASLTSARLGARPATCAARPASLGLRMGFFDGLAKAVNDGMTVQGATKPAAVDPSTFSGWIERSGMQAFTFDGVPAGEIPVSGAISMAGRQDTTAPSPARAPWRGARAVSANTPE